MVYSFIHKEIHITHSSLIEETPSADWKMVCNLMQSFLWRTAHCLIFRILWEISHSVSIIYLWVNTLAKQWVCFVNCDEEVFVIIPTPLLLNRRFYIEIILLKGWNKHIIIALIHEKNRRNYNLNIFFNNNN